MKIPRDVYGNQFALHLERRWEYTRISQSGSHIRLRTQTPSGHAATVPAHKPMKTGTFHGILKDVAEHKRVSVDDILKGL